MCGRRHNYTTNKTTRTGQVAIDGEQEDGQRQVNGGNGEGPLDGCVWHEGGQVRLCVQDWVSGSIGSQQKGARVAYLSPIQV